MLLHTPTFVLLGRLGTTKLIVIRFSFLRASVSATIAHVLATSRKPYEVRLAKVSVALCEFLRALRHPTFSTTSELRMHTWQLVLVVGGVCVFA